MMDYGSFRALQVVLFSACVLFLKELQQFGQVKIAALRILSVRQETYEIRNTKSVEQEHSAAYV